MMPVKRYFILNRSTWLLCVAAALGWGWAWHGATRSTVDGWLFPLQRAEWLVQDMMMRKGPPAPVSTDLVFLGIDNPNYGDRFFEDEAEEAPALAHLGKDYPWSREVWAALVDRLLAAGAKTVVFDLLFVAQGPGDEAFAEALRRHEGRVVLAANLNRPDAGGSAVLVWPASTLIEGLEKPADTMGVVNYLPDGDGVIRRLYYEFPLLSGRYRSLTAQALAQAGREPGEGSRVSPYVPVRFNYGGPPEFTYPHRAVYEVFVPSLWRRNFKDGEFFKDKIVMVGPAANWTQDLHPTPHGMMFGAEIHLNAMAAVMNDAFVTEPSAAWTWALILAAGALAALLLSATENVWLRFGGLVLVSAGGVLAARGVYGAFAFMPVLLAPLLAFNTGGLLCLVQKFFVTLLEKLRTRAMLERYVSQNFVREILDRSDSFEESLGGVRKDCTMLFSDIRGFTTMTEADDSQALVGQLNEYLSEMVECVFRRQGTLDKFIGDAVMAVWGNVRPRTAREDAVDAVRCALDMLDGLARLNPAWVARGRPALKVGIGLNHGEVIVGNMGSPRRKEFTVIGDPVNLASRLEGVTKEYGLSLVIGESVAALVKDDFVLQPVDLIQVKGKQRPVEVFTVIAPADAALSETLRASLGYYGEGMSAYREGRFGEAREAFARAAATDATNTLAKLYVTRCELLLATPPEGEWNGVFVMRTK